MTSLDIPYNFHWQLKAKVNVYSSLLYEVSELLAGIFLDIKLPNLP